MKLLNIPFSQAFAHCAGTFSYWAFIAVALVVAAVIIYAFLKQNDSASGVTTGGVIAFGVAIAIVALSIVYRPGEISANTTPEQAARGVFIGY